MELPVWFEIGSFVVLGIILAEVMFIFNDQVLPEAFAHDPERLARFHREAQVAAQLGGDLPCVDTTLAQYQTPMAEGHGEVYTDFALHSDTFSRMVLLTGGLSRS